MAESSSLSKVKHTIFVYWCIIIIIIIIII